MTKNAFTASPNGIDLYEPEMDWKEHETVQFLRAAQKVTNKNGCAIIMSQTVAIDALLFLRQIIDDELTLRAECELANA